MKKFNNYKWVTYNINNTLKITKKCLFFIDIVLTRHN